MWVEDWYYPPWCIGMCVGMCAHGFSSPSPSSSKLEILSHLQGSSSVLDIQEKLPGGRGDRMGQLVNVTVNKELGYFTAPFSLIPKLRLQGRKHCCFLERDSRGFVDPRQCGCEVAVNHKCKLSLGKTAFSWCTIHLQSKTALSRLADKSIQERVEHHRQC